MNRRALVAFARVLPVHLAINIHGHKTRFVETDQNLAVFDRAGGRFALWMHGGSANCLAVDAGDFDLHGPGGFKVHIGMRPARKRIKIGVRFSIE